MPSREYPQAPLIGVGAVVFDAEYSVLLIRRGNEPLKGHLSLPGGLVELGEKLEEAVVRELREETGLIVEPISLAGIFDRVYREEDGRIRYHYVVADYLCRITGGEPYPASDADEVLWISRSTWSGADSQLDGPTIEAIHLAYKLAEQVSVS